MSKKKYYPDVNPNPNFPELETKILEFWKTDNTFQKSIDQREGAKEFIFYDGPPFANGLPHYGHLLTGYVKDIFARYQTMLGKKVERRFGWDCHGLPAEMGAEKELGVSGRAAIMNYGIEKFNQQCRTDVMKYAHEWEKYVNRQARWVDFKNDYKTMDKSFMESVMWAFKQLYDKGLVYEAMRVMPYSWAAETPLSNFETRLDNAYRERADKAVTVAFELEDGRRILAWTTTPWTLPSNLALAVSSKIKYTNVKKDGVQYVLAASSLDSYKKDLRQDILQTERLTLRPFTEADSDLSYQLHSNPEVGKTVIDGVQTREQSDQTLKSFIAHQKKYGYSPYAVFTKSGNQFIGRAGYMFRTLDPDQPEQMELRYALLPEFWNQGYASELAEFLTDYSFANYPIEKFTAIADPVNKVSHKILEKCNFSYIKTFTFNGKECVYYEVTKQQYEAAKFFNGNKLLGLTYKPLFPYFANHPNSFKIIEGDFIEEGSGTGVVHIAPGFGEDDQRVAEANGIELVVPVDNAGKFTHEVPDYEGMNVFDANDEIIKALKANSSWIKTEQYLHNYPHCWRTDTPLIYKALPSWYVEVTKFKDRMVELNQGINWIPEHVKDGLFGKWLENARDWSISRNRFWGAPIPIWRSKSGKLKCVGSIVELERLSGKKVADLHRPFIDDVTFIIDGEEYKRVEDVLDCWFESGSMPFASQGFRGQDSGISNLTPDTRNLIPNFPADFIVEYTAQTRGWFYTMMVLSTALFDAAPFTNCICHGVVLDSAGQKLSKRLNNYPDPLNLFSEFGSDALRWAMLSSPIMRGQELYIDKEGKFIRDVVRLYIKPIWNAYNFFVLYANADGVEAKFSTTPTPPSPLKREDQGGGALMDQYILAKAGEAVQRIKTALDNYHTPDAYAAVEAFFEVLNNWYIRRSKERFWKTEADEDKQSGYNTLYTVLHIMCRAAAPLLPLTLEEIYKTLSGEESLHLTDFPVELTSQNDELVAVMDKVRDVCNAALSIRSAQNIRVRQPLAGITIVGNLDILKPYEEIIKDELNIKSISFATDISSFAEYKLKINFSILGKRLPEKMKQIIPAAKQNKWARLPNGNIEIIGEELTKEECELLLEPKDKTNSAPLSTNDALVVINLKLTAELINEGLARDIVRMVQQARKDAGLNVADRINLTLETTAEIAGFTDYIKEQTLAKTLDIGTAKGTHIFENELDGEKIKIALSLS